MNIHSRLIPSYGRLGALLFLFFISMWFTHSSEAQTAKHYIVQVTEWQPLEDDAVFTLQALGHADPYLTSRNEIRAYVFGQLFNLLKSSAPDAAKFALLEKIREFRANAFHNALSSHDWYAHNGCWDDTDVFGCLIGDFFGEAPNYAQFTQMGTMEAFGDMANDEKALQIKLEVMRALSWYAAHADLPDEQIYVYDTLPPNEGYDAFRHFATGLASQAASQLFGDLVTMGIEAVVLKALPGLATNSGAATYAASGVTVVAGAIVAAYTTYHIADRVVLHNTIRDRAENPNDEPLEIDKLTTTPAGITELFEVVIAHTLGPMSITDHACQLQSGTNQHSDCRAYTLVDDPDYVDERYTSIDFPFGLPLPNYNESTNFWRGQEGDNIDAMQITNELTHSNALASTYTDIGFVPWSTIIRTNYQLPNAPHTKVSESGPWSFRTRSAFEEVKAYVAENRSLVSYQIGTYPNQVDSSWKYTHALNYTNWNNEWWTAWLVGGQFLQKKQAEKMPGRVVVTEYNGNNRCFQIPPSSGLFTGGWEPQGPQCLLGHNTDFSQLQAGDRIFVGGLTRIVQAVVNCTKQFDLLGLWEACDHSQITDSKAIVVSEAFPKEFYSYTFRGDIVFNTQWDFDYAKWYSPVAGIYDDCSDPLLVSTEENLLNGPPSDRDCYFSPLIQYNSNGPVTSGNWNSLIASPYAVMDDSAYYTRQAGVSNVPVPYKTYEDGALDITLPERGLFANDRVPTIDHPKGIFPWSDNATTSVTLLTPESELHGELELRENGTFTYTPQTTLNDWEERNWQQQFQYELCDTSRVDRCASATVTVNIDNSPPRAIEPDFQVIPPPAGESDYTLLFTDYTYQDEEGDPEDHSKTELCWLRLNPSSIVLQSACWFGDEEAISLNVPISDYIDAGSNWYLKINPHATRGIPLHGNEPGNFSGSTLLVSLQGANNEEFSSVSSLDLICKPGGEGYQSVSTHNAWVQCTFELSPYVAASIYFDSHPAPQPWSIAPPLVVAYLPYLYHQNHEKTFTGQLCELEHNLENDTGSCSVYWLSEPVPQELFPLYSPSGPYDGDAVHTTISGTVIDNNGAEVFGTLGSFSAVPFVYSKTDTVVRSLSSSAGVIQSPNLVVDVKHNESSQVILPASPDGNFSDFVIIDPPVLGLLDNLQGGTVIYWPGASACCTTDSFSYQICDSSEPSTCSLPGTVTLNITDGQAPTIESSVQPEGNAAGWHNVAVTVTFVCTDEHSSVEFCSGKQIVYDQGENVSITGFAYDSAGNSAQTSKVLNIDKVAPSVTYTVEQESPTAYRIHFLCGTDLSGIVNGCPESLLISDTSLNDGISILVSDLADNTTVLTIQRDVIIDSGDDDVPGDWDKDGDVDMDDVRGLYEAILSREPIEMDFDLNNDGVIDSTDLRIQRTMCTRSRCAIN